ncbi:MAG: hypothetical protein Q8P85_10180 [Pseudomonas sp.]|nr:hypothetical protein [Pseudomonas sp.]
MASSALADALNHTANQARQVLRVEMSSVFDSPTRWVLDSVRIINAKPLRDLEQIEAVVTVKDGDLGSKGHGFDEWFSPQVYGSSRLTKGSEKMLRAAGILPRGRFITPTDHTPMDSNGGIARDFIGKVLSGLKVVHKSGSDHNATDSARSLKKGHAKAFFVIKRGKVPIGIAERRGEDDMRVVLMFTRGAPHYRERFRFHDVVRRVAENDAQLEANINKAITDALTGKLPTNFRRRPQSQPKR